MFRLSVTMIIRLEAGEAVTTERDIKQFGGHKKINIYETTKNLNKYKSLETDFRNGREQPEESDGIE